MSTSSAFCTVVRGFEQYNRPTNSFITSDSSTYASTSSPTDLFTNTSTDVSTHSSINASASPVTDLFDNTSKDVPTHSSTHLTTNALATNTHTLTYRIGDFCAGIGGIRLGFQQAAQKCNINIITKITSEIDKNCVNVIKNNFTELPGHIWDHDIMSLDINNIPDIDILTAGFPCQTFSTIGKRKGFSEVRGTIFFNIFRILEHKRPMAFLLENVKGLVHHDHGRSFSIIKDHLRNKLGYVIYYQILDSLDFGLAQHRERIYIVGFREFRNFKFPEKISRSVVLRDILDIDVHPHLYLQQQTWDNLKSLKEAQKIKSSGFGCRVRPLGAHAGTITKGGWGITNLIEDKRYEYPANDEYIRRLSVTECARLQGYPDWWVFSNQNTISYAQLGNTVSINVIDAIAQQIYHCLQAPAINISSDKLLIIDFIKIMFYRDTFTSSCSKSIKFIKDIIISEPLDISDVDIFLSTLLELKIVDKINNTYVYFNKEFKNYKNTYDLVRYCLSSILCCNDEQITNQSQLNSTIFVLQQNNEWSCYCDGTLYHDISNYPILSGVCHMLSLCVDNTRERYKIYIDSKKVWNILTNIFIDTEHFDNWIKEHWTCLSAEEFELYKTLYQYLPTCKRATFCCVRRHRHQHHHSYIKSYSYFNH